MSKLMIPHLGYALTLSKPWTFGLVDETRNRPLANELNIDFYAIRCASKKSIGESIVPVTLPVGTILTVDRLYIRRGQSGFDSVSFYAQIPTNNQPGSKSKKRRFFAKLEDVNNIEFSQPARPLSSLSLEELDAKLIENETAHARLNEARRELVNRLGLNKTSEKPEDVDCLDDLIDAENNRFNTFCQMHGLAPMSAKDLLYYVMDRPRNVDTRLQIKWLEEFIPHYNALIERRVALSPKGGE